MDKVPKMKNGWNGKFLYSFGGIILCLFLIVGLVHMIMENSVPKHEKKEERTQESVEKKEQKDLRTKCIRQLRFRRKTDFLLHFRAEKRKPGLKKKLPSIRMI